jgi:uncharacterized lipoprotein YmbA
MTQKWIRWSVLIFLSGTSTLLGGCSIIKVQPDRTNFYLLVPEPHKTQKTEVPEILRKASIGIGPVSVPAYLKRSEILILVRDTQIDPSQWDRWGEPLDKNIPRVLSENLSDAFGNNHIIRFPWYPQEAPDYQVEAEIIRFDITAEREIILTANWTVSEVTGHKRSWTRRTEKKLRSPSHDMGDVTATMSSALGLLSEEIEQLLCEAAAKA